MARKLLVALCAIALLFGACCKGVGSISGTISYSKAILKPCIWPPDTCMLVNAISYGDPLLYPKGFTFPGTVDSLHMNYSITNLPYGTYIVALEYFPPEQPKWQLFRERRSLVKYYVDPDTSCIIIDGHKATPVTISAAHRHATHIDFFITEADSSK
jgi:hypothetical protein